MFPPTLRERGNINSVLGIVTTVIILLCFAFIPSGAAVFVIKERETSFKHLQVLAGMSNSAYWVANYLYDMCVYTIAASASAALIYYFGGANFGGDGLLVTTAAFALYGAAVYPFSYLVSLGFSSHSTGQNAMLLLFILLSIVLLTVSTVLRALPSTAALYATYLRYAFRVLPNFALADAVYNVAMRDTVPGLGVWDWQFSLWNFVFLGAEAVAFFALTLLVECAADPIACRSCRRAPSHSRRMRKRAPVSNAAAAAAATAAAKNGGGGSVAIGVDGKHGLNQQRDDDDDDDESDGEDEDVVRERVRLAAVESASASGDGGNGNGNGGANGWADRGDSNELISLFGLRKVCARICIVLSVFNRATALFATHLFKDVFACVTSHSSPARCLPVFSDRPTGTDLPGRRRTRQGRRARSLVWRAPRRVLWLPRYDLMMQHVSFDHRYIFLFQNTIGKII